MYLKNFKLTDIEFKPKATRQKIVVVLILILFFFLSVTSSWAITLLTEKEALFIIFPGTDDLMVEEKTATDEDIAKIREKLSGMLVRHKRGEEWKDIESRRKFTFYSGLKGGKVIGTAMILDEPGKWGMIRFIIRIGVDNKIEQVRVMKYKESRGRPIARRTFLKQFTGKKLSDSIKINKDIQAISGATISSAVATFTVRKALAIYEILVKQPDL